jgi:hypothetical protein
VGTALSYGWKKFTENAGPLILVFLLPGVAQIILSSLGQLVIRSIVGVLIFQVVGWVVGAILGIGIYRVALMITAGERPDIAKAYQYDRWGEWILFSIVFGLMVGIGIAICIIPGLFVLAFFGLAPFYFIDGRMSLGQSLTAAREAASSKGLAFPVLLAIIVGALGLIACLIGVLITAPVAYVAVAYLYRYAAGQPVAA